MQERMNLDVLVVDDSETQRFHTKVLLEERGCKVREAGDGKHALEMLKFFKPDVMILDFTMPGMDGFGLLRLLQGDPTTSDIPIIVLTAKMMDASMRNEIEMEPNVERVFAKPPDIPALFEIVRQVSKSKGKYKEATG